MRISDTAEKCHQSLADSRQMSNTTSSNMSLECSVFNEQCLCRRSSNGTRVPRHCINPLQLHTMRILPPLSFVFQSFALHEFFKDGAKCNPVFVRLRWLVSSFSCGAITSAMFCNHRHHINIIVSIFASSVILAQLGTIACAKRAKAENEIRRENTARLNPPPERTNNDPKSWDNIVWFNRDFLFVLVNCQYVHSQSIVVCMIVIFFLFVNSGESRQCLQRLIVSQSRDWCVDWSLLIAILSKRMMMDRCTDKMWRFEGWNRWNSMWSEGNVGDCFPDFDSRVRMKQSAEATRKERRSTEWAWWPVEWSSRYSAASHLGMRFVDSAWDLHSLNRIKQSSQKCQNRKSPINSYILSWSLEYSVWFWSLSRWLYMYTPCWWSREQGNSPSQLSGAWSTTELDVSMEIQTHT